MGSAAQTAEGGEATIGVPAPGQLVTVRNRQWIAAEIVRSEVTSGDPHVIADRATHLVTLASIEDDTRDEELRVVWELEPAAAVHDSAVLPSPEQGFDEPTELAAFLHAVRWGAIASADTTALQAPFRSGIQIEDYQLDPVVRALSMPRTNLLIADDVGLGKTIEAGLVMQELFLRHRARTMMIVCPAGLTFQWRDEMREKFGLDFRIVDADLLKKLRRQRGLYVNPWTHYPRLIVSVDWLKRDRPMRLLREVLPVSPRYPRAFDLLVVDEVHSCAPSGRGKYAVDSLRTKAIRALAPHCEHRLFLSATPHNGYLESFTALLEMLDDQRFARGVKPTDEQLAKIMVRRLKRTLPKKWDGSDRFSGRKIHYLELDYSEDERDAHALLRRYSASRRDTVAGHKASKSAADFVTTLLKRRMFSSPKALAETVETHLETMDGRERDQQKAGGQQILRTTIERLDETAEDDAAYAEAETAALTAARNCAPPLTSDERAMLVELKSWALGAQDRPDAKFRELLGWLDPIVRSDGDWTDQRVIVFTEYRDTQRWLEDRLISAGYPAERLELLYGGQDEQKREEIKNRFTAEPELDPVRVLIATDAASEGINLQRHCHRVLHWEIPWNPNRLEQRNGRVDRHGQRAAEVEIRHFVPAGWQDTTFSEGSLEDELDFLRIAVEKVDRIREDLGSAGDVISAQVERKMLGGEPEWVAVDDEIAKRASRARLKVERDLARDLQRLTETLAGSRAELDLTPDTVEQVVRTGLRLAHRRDLQPATAPKGFAAPVFRLPELPGAWAAARNTGLYHPLTGNERPVTFDQDAVTGHDDVVLLHLGHQLVQMCLRLLRAELWAQARGSGASKLSRVTARVVPGDVLLMPAVVAHGRVVVTGAEGTRLHEEVMAAGGLIDEGKLRRANAEDITSWLAAASSTPVPEEFRSRLADLWPELSDPLAKLLSRRAADRTRSMEALLRKRCDEEVAGISAVLDELAQSIRQALDATDQWQQGSLFSLLDQEERDQLHTDHDSLINRLEMIPDQREGESAALRRRYADPVARWFPAAVEFLVPESLVKGGL
ncbi:DISARM system SNF2-like helicase DrmD [Amycolatopsis sp. NPDC057786]|uniref:DISARM system SNF2-like helicase DrmD n=1 Tax=Amycolatopsis sp. NPDC057786 TaxID=3346250 RepID=UPI00366AE856